MKAKTTESILILNKALDDLGTPWAVNKKIIENLLRELEGAYSGDDALYWLTMARLLELTLLCAGNYADACEFSAAGDLLVNNRKVHIHQKGNPHPLVKKRHGRLSDQLNSGSVCPQHLRRQRRNEILLEIVTPPLLP